jgi:hypothetical protein
MFGTKTGKLKDDTLITLRPMVAGDEEALFRFFQGLPDDLLIFIRHNVKNRRVIQEWVKRLNYERVLPLLGFVGDDIVADVTSTGSPMAGNGISGGCGSWWRRPTSGWVWRP